MAGKMVREARFGAVATRDMRLCAVSLYCELERVVFRSGLGAGGQQKTVEAAREFVEVVEAGMRWRMAMSGVWRSWRSWG
eukprot:1461459-Rhodomonas_salina.2